MYDGRSGRLIKIIVHVSEQVPVWRLTDIHDVLAAIPPHAEHPRPDVKQRLAAQTHLLDAGQLRILGRRELAFLDQDGKPPNDDEAQPRRSFTMRDTRSAHPGCTIRQSIATPTTWCHGLMVAPPPYQTSCCSANGTTGSSTTLNGPSK